ncbi:hypothetical protein L7F22_058787 [Adiantum nelumboides]|nr:hypothetical protein [Adiantum nelumboides]
METLLRGLEDEVPGWLQQELDNEMKKHGGIHRRWYKVPLIVFVSSCIRQEGSKEYSTSDGNSGSFPWRRVVEGKNLRSLKKKEKELQAHLEVGDEEDNEEWRPLYSDGEIASEYKADEDDDADISDNPPPSPLRSVTKALQPTQESNDQNNTNKKMSQVPLPLKGPPLATEPNALSMEENLLSQRPLSNWKPPRALSKGYLEEQMAIDVSTVVEVGGLDQEPALVVGAKITHVLVQSFERHTSNTFTYMSLSFLADIFVQCNSPSHEEEEDPMIAINPFSVSNIESQKLPQGKQALPCKWVYKKKYTTEDPEPKYKARLVAKGFKQKKGVDFDEIFSPVVKMTTLRLVLGLVATEDLELNQMDVKTTFLHKDLEEDVYMVQPERFEMESEKPKKLVCRLCKALCGFKQGSR